MLLLRVCVAAVVAVVVVICDPAVETQAKKPLPDMEFDYLDEVKDFSDIKDEVNARYSAKINKMDMLEDYPHDDDDDDHHHHHYQGDVGDEDYDDEDYDDEDDELDGGHGDEDEDDDDDDDDDEEGGGCGGDDDDEDEEPTPVQQVIEDYFTR